MAPIRVLIPGIEVIGDSNVFMIELIVVSISSISSVMTSARRIVCFSSMDLAGMMVPMDEAAAVLMAIAISRP